MLIVHPTKGQTRTMRPELIVCLERLSSVIKTENDADGYREEEKGMHFEKTENEVDQDLDQKLTIKCEEENFINSQYFISHEELEIKGEDDVEQSDSQVSAIGKKGYRQSNKRVAAHSAEPNTTDQLYKCNNCSYETPCKPYIKHHVRLHSSRSYKIPVKKGLKTTVRHKPKDQIIHKCPDCSYQSKYKNSIKQHSIRHKKPDEIVWHRCTECPYKSLWKPNLKQHAIVHNETRRFEIFKCAHCTYETPRIPSLKRHQMRHEHADDPSWFKCPMCPIKTNCKYELLRHAKKHIDRTERIGNPP